MTRRRISRLLGLCLGLMMLSVGASPQGQRFECFFCSFNRFATSGTPANPQFDRIKSLAGSWTGLVPNWPEPAGKGKPIGVVYTVTSNGSAVVETLHPPEGPTMVTMYYRDGDRLLATHYCSVGNQPRMAVVPSTEPNQITFSFVDGTNLAQASGHMQGLTLRFKDRDHLAQKWTFLHDNGKVEIMDVTLHRVR